LNAQVLGISVDHIPCLQAWADSLGGLSFPLLSDFWPHGRLASQFGVLREDGKSERAIFIVDPDGIICYVDVHNIDDQPDNEILFAELERLLPHEKKPAHQAGGPDEFELPSGGVIMYCTPWCSDCTSAKEWLRQRDIAFKEVNVSIHREGAASWCASGRMGTSSRPPLILTAQLSSTLTRNAWQKSLVWLRSLSYRSIFSCKNGLGGVFLTAGMAESWWAPRSSKPVAGRVAGRGGFDSHPFPPVLNRGG
jgi:glutaredoxin